MKLKEATNRAEEEDIVKEILDKGGCLCSAYIFLRADENISKWELAYYEPETDKITPVSVSDKIEIAASDKPLKDKIHKISIENISFGAEDSLKKSKQLVKDEYGKKIQKILLSLKQDEKLFWNIVFITSSFSTISIKINAEDGTILEDKEESLMQKNTS